MIAFLKKIEECTLIHFFELFGQEHKFETWFEIFLGMFFLK